VRPTTRFAKLGNDRIGYQILGDGPIDLVFLTGMSSHVDLRWEEPLNECFLHRLASFSRLILFDRRGAGVSDPVPFDDLPTWEQWADDLRVVLDTIGSERAAIMAWLDGGPMAMLFAAIYPERTVALVLAHTAARYVRADQYPHGLAPEVASRGAPSGRPGRFRNRSGLSGSTSGPGCMPGRSSCGRADIVWAGSPSTSPLG
jgi:pimeloyl-ACP methyl ester carboxylesterase